MTGSEPSSPAAFPSAGVENGRPPVLETGRLAWTPAADAGRPAAAAAQARAEAVAGTGAYNRGQFGAALRHYGQAVRLQPAEAEYHCRLARVALWCDRPDLVERHFLEAVRLDPAHADTHDGLGQWYLAAGYREAALRHSAAAAVLAPGDAGIAAGRASVLADAGDVAGAWELLGPLVRGNDPAPRPAAVFTQLAAKLGTEERAAAVAAAGRALESPGIHPAAARLLHFSTSALLDQLGRYDEAFGHARRGNDLARANRPPYDPAADADRVARRINYYTRRRLKALPRATLRSRRPVLIVGMPRSGTSLVEQILASHPAVYGAGELRALGDIAWSGPGAGAAGGETYPECLDALSVRQADRLAARYLAGLEALDAGAAYVTDKMPVNFLYLGLAEVLLPGCRVIHCVRDPLDTCVSCYLTDFACGNEFALDLGHLGAFYRGYRRLMDHWRGVLSLPILEVRYEDVVLDPEGQSRRMAEFLELSWDNSCLAFHENKRRVKTASKEQVTRPVYSSSVGRWRNYEKHLAPLLAALAGRRDVRAA